MEIKAIYKEIGKTLAPVEIDSEEALELFGITKKDLVPYVVGTKKIMVHVVPASPEVCSEMLKDLRQKYTKLSREERCMIQGAYGKAKICPDCYSCSECPFGQDEKQPRSVSLEALWETGEEEEAPALDALSVVDVRDFLEHLEKQNPRYVEIVQLRGMGYSEQEIARMLDIPLHSVKYARKKVREFAGSYFRGVGKENL